MKYSQFISLFLLFLVSSCSIFVDEYQTNQKKVIEFLLSDLPIPEDSSIMRDSTVLLGNGDNVSGRIMLDTSSSPAENLIFYSEEALASGWELMSSKVGEEITLIYFKNGRYATLEMRPKRSFGGFIAGSVGSSINISISHPDSVTLENPFLGLTENIPD
jgi:hypothetical protein|tara:strand:+ start:149 stop:628 length:480 start_codon:yes stop_codon:yes gene_type:complete